MSEDRVCLLVDGDNISPLRAEILLKYAAKEGRLDIARVYFGDVQDTQWITAPGYRFLQAGAGRNSADLLMSIDAMEFALAGGLRRFVIGSSDSDFIHIAERLREIGCLVVGIGEAKAAERFRAACSRFTVLPEPVIRAVAKPVSRPAPAKPKVDAKGPSPLDHKIRTLIGANSTSGAGMPIAALGAQMNKQHAVKISTLSEKTWRAYLAARTQLYSVDPRGPDAKVRFLRAGFE